MIVSHFLSEPTQARCSEDLLRNKIKTLEAQLQVCLQVRTAAGGKEAATECFLTTQWKFFNTVSLQRPKHFVLPKTARLL